MAVPGRIARHSLSPQILSLVATLLPRSALAGPSPLRAEILATVAATPGITFSKLRERVPAGWGTLYHHVWKLTNAGELETRVIGRRRLLYLRGTAQAAEVAALGLVRGKTARLVAATIAANPHLSFKDLVERTGESERVVYYHLKRLIGAGLVSSSSRTRHYNLVATPMLESSLAAVTAEERSPSTH